MPILLVGTLKGHRKEGQWLLHLWRKNRFFFKLVLLTNRIMSCSCLWQHVEQRGIVGKGGNIERNQALVTHPVHPSLPLFHPILLFPIFSLPHVSPSPSATVDVVFGQQALDSQRVLILHCLPQALVLQGSKQDMWCREREDTLKKTKTMLTQIESSC